MQGWCSVGSGEDHHEQAAKARREQENRDSRSPCRNCETRFPFVLLPPSALRFHRNHAIWSFRNIPLLIWLLSMQVSAGLVPDGRHFVSRARDEASSWRSTYKGPIPISAIANRLGGYVQAYTLYSSVRPFGVTAIVGGWDTEAELPVDGQVGSGPKSGSGGKVEGAKAGGPGLYMIEPSGLYWVRCDFFVCAEWMDYADKNW
jgi:hypothetical protein